MTTLETLSYATGRSLAVDQVEELLAAAEDRRGAPIEWHLDLSATRHVQPLAGARLAAVLRTLARHRLVVTLPARENRYRVLYRSGLAPAIAQHAHETRGESDAALAQLREDPHALEANSNVLLFNRVDDGALALDKNRFGARLWSAASRSLPHVEQGLARPTRAALVEAGYEGIANVVDHAFAAPFADEADRRVAFCLLSWQEEMTAKAGDPLGLAPYLEQADARLEAEGRRWFMLSVVDDGVGIPARQARDEDVYTGPLASEELALAQALEAGSSVKLAANDAELRGDPGWGLSLMAGALEQAHGYGCLRTGRHLVELDAFSARRGWQLRPQQLAPLRGTVLVFVLPVEDPQLRLV